MVNKSNEEWLEAFANFLNRRFPERSTAKHYVNDIRIFMRHYSGMISAVTSTDIDAFVDQQRADGLATTSVNRRVAALKTFFDFAGEMLGWGKERNPVVRRRHAAKPPRQLPRDLSNAEVERFLAVVENLRDRALTLLMLYGGLRVGEVVLLRPIDITRPDSTEAPLRLRVLGKGRKERVVFLHPTAAEPLLAYLAQRAPTAAEQPLFHNRFQQPLSIAGVQNRVSSYGKQSGVPVTCHRLRHTYGRWLAEGEMPLLSLARLLGHTHLSTTQRYIDGANPQVQRDYEAAMNRAQIESAAPPPSPLTPATTTEPAVTTVSRPEPALFATENWMTEWPAWLRQGCLAWLQHQWLRWQPSRRRECARRASGHLRLFWRWQLAHHPIMDWSELSAVHLNAFVDAQLSRNLAPTSVRTILGTLYALLTYQLEQGHLSALPPKPTITLPGSLPKHLQPDELLTLERWAAQQRQTSDPSTLLSLALYYILAHTGLRICELLDLRVQDLHLSTRRLMVRQGKKQKDRVVFLTDSAVSLLQNYLSTVPHAPGDLVFSYQNRPLTYEQAWRRLRDLGNAVGIAHLSPLRLRHTYATTLLNNGMTLPALSRLMGHENLTTTMIYAHLADTTVEAQYRLAMVHILDNVGNSV
jgi:integrase/recombinase XerD